MVKQDIGPDGLDGLDGLDHPHVESTAANTERNECMHVVDQASVCRGRWFQLECGRRAGAPVRGADRAHQSAINTDPSAISTDQSAVAEPSRPRFDSRAGERDITTARPEPLSRAPVSRAPGGGARQRSAGGERARGQAAREGGAREQPRHGEI